LTTIHEQPTMRRRQARVETQWLVVVDNLVKRYPKRRDNAVDDVSFTVERGEIFGLLGPNGAGKTTTIGAMTTRVVPTSGRVLVDGVDVARDAVAAKRRFGVVPQVNNLDRALTARQNLLFHGAYFGFSRQRREEVADGLLDELGLAEHANERTERFSGGMAQRLMIARALMHRPELLFLDEPSTGLDPQSRLFVHDRIRELNARGVTAVITTHDMLEAEKLCRRIAIVDHGKLLALGTVDELRARVPGSTALELRVGPHDDIAGLIETLAGLPGVESAERVAGAEDGESPRVRLYSANGSQLVAPVVQAVAAHGAEVRDLRLARATLEDVFIHLTGRALR
jgi:ABC-2 type transport system ATP-binding protein